LVGLTGYLELAARDRVSRKSADESTGESNAGVRLANNPAMGYVFDDTPNPLMARGLGSVDMTNESVTQGAEFVERQVNARHCPFCGAEHWILIPDIGAFTGGSPTPGGAPDSPAGEEVEPPFTYYPAVSYYCQQCGFVRTHLLPD